MGGGKFTWGNKAKYCWVMSTNFLFSKVCWQHLKQTFPSIIWIRLPFKIFSTLHKKLTNVYKTISFEIQSQKMNTYVRKNKGHISQLKQYFFVSFRWLDFGLSFQKIGHNMIKEPKMSNSKVQCYYLVSYLQVSIFYSRCLNLGKYLSFRPIFNKNV